MIDPIIFSFEIGDFTLTLHWYGVIIMAAILIGAWLTDREIQRRGGPAEFIWDAIVWVIPAALIGARLWYVLNATLGGSTYFTDQPGRILNLQEGGLHIFGGLLLGGLAAYWYARRHKVDWLLILDSLAPAILISQALARPANFINQELYGQPTDLPWGISIDAINRLPQYNDLSQFPVDTTRFHPTFAYEMIWNLIFGGLLLWLGRKFSDKLKPGTIFAGWLIAAGVGRAIIETFRPDQPMIPGTILSYSRLIAILMAVLGVIWLLVRYEKIRLKFWKPGRSEYRIRPYGPALARARAEKVAAKKKSEKKPTKRRRR